MPIDYSKWDKLEISDDSDIEVHPNVDKNSFIRWKQQDIHQKRDQRNQEIATYEVQVPMYTELNRRVDKMLADSTDDLLGNFGQIKAYLKKSFDNDTPKGVEEDAPTYNEMIEDLVEQLKTQLEKAGQNPNDGSLLRDELKNHRKKIDAVLVTQQDKLKTLYKERELHISSDDIHTGWDHSFMNKGESKPSPGLSPASTTKSPPVSAASSIPSPQIGSYPSASSTVTTPPTSPSTDVVTTSQQQVQVEEDEADIQMHPDTAELSKIPITNTDAIKNFLKAHVHIIGTPQKEALLSSAFDAQFAMDDKLTKQYIGHSIYIQNVLDFVEFKKATHPAEYRELVETLFGTVYKQKSQAKDAFNSELDNTFQHIKKRCKILSEESAGDNEGLEQEIQLKSLDDDTQLIVNLPDPSSEDPDEQQRYEIFKTLPPQMQEALKSETLDAVNEVFHGMPIEEAEAILEIFDKGDIIGLRAVLENENEWAEIQEQYAQEQQGAEGTEEPELAKVEELEISDEEEVVNTADIVD